MQHAHVAFLDGEGNREHEVALRVRVGPRVEVPMEEWMSGWMTQTIDDVPSVLAESPICFDNEGTIGEIETLVSNHPDVPRLFAASVPVGSARVTHP